MKEMKVKTLVRKWVEAGLQRNELNRMELEKRIHTQINRELEEIRECMLKELKPSWQQTMKFSALCSDLQPIAMEMLSAQLWEKIGIKDGLLLEEKELDLGDLDF